MEIAQRKSEDMISEAMIDDLTESINKSILEKLKANFPYEYWEPDKRKLFEEKFDIKSAGDKKIPYNVLWFIHQKIEEDIHNGYIERTYKDDNGKLHTEKINLDELEKIIYVYDTFYDDKSIIRIHKYKSENNLDEPIYAPYILNDPNKIYPHQNFKVKSKYALTDVGYYSEMQYVSFLINTI